MQLTPKTIMHDPETRKSTVYATITAETIVGPASWELIQMLSFNESGDKLVRLDEFFDSKVYLDMMANMHKQDVEAAR